MIPEITETRRCILPYTFHRLPYNRVQIVHPMGMKLVYTRSHVESILLEAYPERHLSSHERMMWEQALRTLDEQHSTGL